MNLTKKNTKLVTLVLAITLIVFSAAISRTSKATSSQLTSSCGGAINLARKGKGWSDGETVNALIIINFDNSTFEISRTAVDSSMQKGYASQVPGLGTFSLAAGPISGSYILMDAASPPRIPILHLLPVNDGKSILLQGKDDDVVGVCQKI